MTYVITEACIGTKDRSCVDVCPVDCIHDEGDDDKILYIDPDECIDCGACEPACPVNAIFAEDDVPDNLKAYTEINASGTRTRPAPARRSTPSPRSGQSGDITKTQARSALRACPCPRTRLACKAALSPPNAAL